MKSGTDSLMGRLPLFAAPLMMFGCASQPHTDVAGPGFLLGFWHGLTAILALAGSLFLPVRPYAFPNSGFWYDAGFVSGISLVLVLLFLAILPRIGGFIVSRF